MRIKDKEWALAMLVHFRAEHEIISETMTRATARLGALGDCISRFEVLVENCDKPLPPRERPS